VVPTPEDEMAPFNELRQMADRCGLSRSRFALGALADGPGPAPMAEPPAGRRLLDSSSPVFLVDHSACILCDRCIRACNEVQNYNVIGRTGKGPATGIGFDLNDPMFESTCVQCGECMVSCPTSAITFKPVGEVERQTGRVLETVPLAELKQDPLFAGVPAKFLLWQKGLVARRRLLPGDVLCRQGEPSHSAFIVKRGRLQVLQRGSVGALAQPVTRTVDDVIVGEMACLSGSPRTADVCALDDAEVWEVRRNVLDRMLRSPKQRGLFERLYRDRALETAWRASELFLDLPPEEYARSVEYLEPRLEFVRVNPGQIIFRQGDLADNLYLIRLGHVRIGIGRHGQEATFLYLGPGTAIGETGLLAISEEDTGKPDDEVYRALRAALASLNAGRLLAGRRTSTCSALDHVELARIDRHVFLEMVRQFPALLGNLVRRALNRLRERDAPHMREFVEQGLYQGQSLLALDLTKCTRCDECTKACVRQHGTASHGQPITRLVRDGLRFGDFLVANACRSCKDAYCMIGCPVDAIQRGRHLQIVIEDHCIGCGLCARNCPYGSISMELNTRALMEADDPNNPGQTRLVARPKAATCDLCDAEGREARPTPRCVHACPHDAAHRMTGEQLLAEVNRRAAGNRSGL
jgi:Fe-S-cluster-containing hydrogenase component 2